MVYSKLIWRTGSSGEPVKILSEYDTDGWETRKIEYFADGSVAFANRKLTVGGARLSEIQRPADVDVNSDEMSVAELSADEFETAWKSAQKAATIQQ